MESQEDRSSDTRSTPLARPLYDTASLSLYDRKRVLEADPNEGRCLVTNTKYSLNYCHCIPKSFMRNNEILDSLEWAWNMLRYTLNLNTHQNIFMVKSDFHNLFDNDGWLLMPQNEILDQFCKSLRVMGCESYHIRDLFPDILEKSYFYTFVPLPGMEDNSVDIVRGVGDAAIFHRYPYSTLPKLECHLHPKFAIFDAGRKLKALFKKSTSNPALQKLFDDYPSLTKIQRLYLAWIAPPPDNALEIKSYVDPSLVVVHEPEDGSGDGSGESDNREDDYRVKRTRTVCGRGTGVYLRPRTRSVTAAERNGNGGDDLTKRAKRGQVSQEKAPAVTVKKRKVLSGSSTHNQQLLSEVTLSRINQQLGEAPWTSDRIRQWTRTFPKKRKVVPSLSLL